MMEIISVIFYLLACLAYLGSFHTDNTVKGSRRVVEEGDWDGCRRRRYP